MLFDEKGQIINSQTWRVYKFLIIVLWVIFGFILWCFSKAFYMRNPSPCARDLCCVFMSAAFLRLHFRQFTFNIRSIFSWNYAWISSFLSTHIQIYQIKFIRLPVRLFIKGFRYFLMTDETENVWRYLLSWKLLWKIVHDEKEVEKNFIRQKKTIRSIPQVNVFLEWLVCVWKYFNYKGKKKS